MWDGKSSFWRPFTPIGDPRVTPQNWCYYLIFRRRCWYSQTHLFPEPNSLLFRDRSDAIALDKNKSPNMPPLQYRSVGFIGLGAMGMPMATHLANKLPEETQIHVFDVFKPSVEDLCKRYPGKVTEAKSAKDVANKSVSTWLAYHTPKLTPTRMWSCQWYPKEVM